MRILMLNNEFPPLGGGTGTVNLELFNIFKDRTDISIDLITSASGKKKEIEQFSENIRIYKYPVRKKDIHHASNPELIRYSLKACRTAFKLNKENKYNLVFSWTTVPAGFPAMFLNLFKNIPYIVRIGGPDIPGFEKRYKFIYGIISPLIKFIWKKANFLVVKCKTEKEMINSINKKLEIITINNGIDTQKFNPGQKAENKNLKLICSARLIKRKGQYSLIDSLAKLKSEGIIVEADFVGEGDEKDAYIEYAKEKNVLNQIYFSGYVPREEMPDKYRQSDIFVLPSYNEGMSNALLEAMACGLPAIVTNVGGTEELVDHSNGLIFKPGDSYTLTKHIKFFYLNKEQIDMLGKKSLEKAESLNWKNIADKYSIIFSENIKK